MVISDRGIVATSQTLASQAGAQVLARGGSAVDAAIAANATISRGPHVVKSSGACNGDMNRRISRFQRTGTLDLRLRSMLAGAKTDAPRSASKEWR
jgi:hypothetical protein